MIELELLDCTNTLQHPQKETSSVDTFFVERISAKPNVHVGVKICVQPYWTKIAQKKTQESRFWFTAAPSILIMATLMQASFPAQSRTFKRHGSSVASPTRVTPHPTVKLHCVTTAFRQTGLYQQSSECLQENVTVQARQKNSKRLSRCSHAGLSKNSAHPSPAS